MRPRALISPVVALVIIVLDQVSKYLVATHLVLNEPRYIVPFLKPFFALTYIHNTGAAFGILQNQNLLFSIIAIVVIAIILVYVRSTPQPDLLIALTLGLQLGGAGGNLIDRLRYGYVIDFIYVKYWAISNVADICISLGVVLLGYYLIFRMPQSAAPEQVSPPQAPPSSPAGEQNAHTEHG